MPALSLIFLWQYYCDRCPFTPTETSSVGRGYRLPLTHISHLTASGCCAGHSAAPSIPYPLARRPRSKGCAADIAFRFGPGSSLSALSEPPGCFRKCHIQAHVLPRAIAHYSDQSLVSRPQYAQSCRKAVRSYPFSFVFLYFIFAPMTVVAIAAYSDAGSTLVEGERTSPRRAYFSFGPLCPWPGRWGRVNLSLNSGRIFP